MRTVLVWIISLLLFYITHDDSIGEEWRIPESFFILVGFLVMVSGIWIYYSQKQKEEEERNKEEDATEPEEPGEGISGQSFGDVVEGCAKEFIEDG